MNMMDPILQFGFAGLSVVLLGILVWLVKQFLAAIQRHNEALVEVVKDTTEVIKDNTAAIAAVGAKDDEQLEILREMEKRLLTRPCLIPKPGE